MVKGWIKLPRNLARAGKELSDLEFRLLLYLTSFGIEINDKTGKLLADSQELSVRKIAYHLEKSHSTITKALKKLEEKGLIKIISEKGKRNKYAIFDLETVSMSGTVLFQNLEHTVPKSGTHCSKIWNTPFQ